MPENLPEEKLFFKTKAVLAITAINSFLEQVIHKCSPCAVFVIQCAFFFRAKVKNMFLQAQSAFFKLVWCLEVLATHSLGFQMFLSSPPCRNTQKQRKNARVTKRAFVQDGELRNKRKHSKMPSKS